MGGTQKGGEVFIITTQTMKVVLASLLLVFSVVHCDTFTWASPTSVPSDFTFYGVTASYGTKFIVLGNPINGNKTTDVVALNIYDTNTTAWTLKTFSGLKLPSKNLVGCFSTSQYIACHTFENNLGGYNLTYVNLATYAWKTVSFPRPYYTFHNLSTWADVSHAVVGNTPYFMVPFSIKAGGADFRVLSFSFATGRFSNVTTLTGVKSRNGYAGLSSSGNLLVYAGVNAQYNYFSTYNFTTKRWSESYNCTSVSSNPQFNFCTLDSCVYSAQAKTWVMKLSDKSVTQVGGPCEVENGLVGYLFKHYGIWANASGQVCIYDLEKKVWTLTALSTQRTTPFMSSFNNLAVFLGGNIVKWNQTGGHNEYIPTRFVQTLSITVSGNTTGLVETRGQGQNGTTGQVTTGQNGTTGQVTTG